MINSLKIDQNLLKSSLGMGICLLLTWQSKYGSCLPSERWDLDYGPPKPPSLSPFNTSDLGFGQPPPPHPEPMWRCKLWKKKSTLRESKPQFSDNRAPETETWLGEMQWRAQSSSAFLSRSKQFDLQPHKLHLYLPSTDWGYREELFANTK